MNVSRRSRRCNFKPSVVSTRAHILPDGESPSYVSFATREPRESEMLEVKRKLEERKYRDRAILLYPINTFIVV